MLLQNCQHVLADALRADVVKPKLDDAWQGGLGLKEQLCKVKVVREDDRFVLIRPPHDFGVRGVGRAEFTPVPGIVPALTKEFDPRKRKAVVNDDGHAG